MSEQQWGADTAQGPGWWQASDGKWYPPQSQPQADAGREPRQWRTWHLIATGIAALLLGAAIGGINTDSNGETGLAEAPEDETTTTVDATTTTTDATTTTERETTTTTLSAEQVEARERAWWADAFDRIREDLVATIQEEDPATTSVDAVRFEDPPGQLFVAVTSTYSTREYQAEHAWELGRVLAEMWRQDRTWFPALRLQVSGVERRCEGETMQMLSEARMTRAEWEAACR